MKPASLTAVLLLFLSVSTQAQKKLLTGTWIKSKIETMSGKVTPQLVKRNEGFLKYTFTKDRQLYISTDPASYGMPHDYQIQGDIILLPFFNLKIEKIDEHNLELIELDGNKIFSSSTKTYFTREKTYMDSQRIIPEDYYIKDNDTVFYESEKVYALFDDKTSSFYNDVSYKDIGIKSKEPAFSYATFIIGLDGKVSDVVIYHHVNAAFDKNLKKKILQTSGKWRYPGSKEKSTRKIAKTFTVSYNTISSFAVKAPANVTPDKYSSKLSPDYQREFVSAALLMQRGNYESAVTRLKNCLELTENPVNAYYQLSKCYGVISDRENEALYLEKVKNSPYSYMIGL